MKLVDDFRCFKMLALLYLGPVGMMHFPAGTHVVGSCVQMCLCVRRRPYDAAKEVLLEEWRAHRAWFHGAKGAVLHCLRMVQGGGASVDKVADLIYLYARESELEIGKRVTAVQGPAQAVLDGLRFLPPGSWDPMEWESNAEGATRHADIDICFCQQTQAEARRAVLSIHEQLISHFGQVPVRRTTTHGTVTYFLPWPWRRVQLKCGTRPLLHWLMDADAAPTACCLSISGPELAIFPRALPRAAEAFEHKTNVIHTSALLHRPNATQRAAKYAGRGFKPLLVQCRPQGHLERQEVRRAMGDVARSFRRQKHRNPILGWSAPWQALRETLIMGAEEELAAAIEDEDVLRWCRSGAPSYNLPESLLPFNRSEALAILQRNMSQTALTAEEVVEAAHAEEEQDAAAASTDDGDSGEGQSLLDQLSEGALPLVAAGEDAQEAPPSTRGPLLEALRRHWRDVQPYHAGCIARSLRPGTSLQLALETHPLTASTWRCLDAIEEAMLRYFGASVRRVKPVLTDDGRAVLGGAPRVVAEVCLSYLFAEECQSAASAAELFMTAFMRLAPQCANATSLWNTIWTRRLLQDSADDEVQWLNAFDYCGPGGEKLGERVQGGCPKACALAFDKRCPAAAPSQDFQEVAWDLARAVELPAEEWMEHGYVRRAPPGQAVQ